MIRIKRAYDDPSPDDGYRILVDRLWPRGVTKERAALDLWMKEIAPTNELRKWYAHDLSKWEEFCERYLVELSQNEGAFNKLKELTKKGDVTLVYAGRDREHNEAVFLKALIESGH